MMKFYEEENEKQISFWKFLEITKLTSGLNPTHSFELLKSHRLKQYEDKLVASTDKRLLNELETTLFDISMLYSEWLNNEMKVVEQWLSDKHPNGDKKKPLSFEEKIEIVKYKTFISNEIEVNEKQINPTENKSKQDQPKTLSELITHEKSDEIVEAIKIQYKNIKGKRLKLLLLVFQNLELLPDRIAQKFHTLCKIKFDWNIGHYSAMNDYDFNEKIDGKELEKMKIFIEKIINNQN